MGRIAIMALTIVAALAATSELATARDGCGNGRYWNGYRCVGVGVRYYAPHPYYGQPNYGYNYGYARRNVCGQGWSLQDGQCKPYRGY